MDELLARGDALGVSVALLAEHAAKRGEEALVHVALDLYEEGGELPKGIYLTPRPIWGEKRRGRVRTSDWPALVTLEQCLGRRTMAPPAVRVRYGWSAAPHVWSPCEDLAAPWTWSTVTTHVREATHPSGLTGAWDVRGRGSAPSIARRCRDEALSRLLTRAPGVAEHAGPCEARC